MSFHTKSQRQTASLPPAASVKDISDEEWLVLSNEDMLQVVADVAQVPQASTTPAQAAAAAPRYPAANGDYDLAAKLIAAGFSPETVQQLIVAAGISADTVEQLRRVAGVMDRGDKAAGNVADVAVQRTQDSAGREVVESQAPAKPEQETKVAALWAQTYSPPLPSLYEEKLGRLEEQYRKGAAEAYGFLAKAKSSIPAASKSISPGIAQHGGKMDDAASTQKPEHAAFPLPCVPRTDYAAYPESAMSPRPTRLLLHGKKLVDRMDGRNEGWAECLRLIATTDFPGPYTLPADVASERRSQDRHFQNLGSCDLATCIQCQRSVFFDLKTRKPMTGNSSESRKGVGTYGVTWSFPPYPGPPPAPVDEYLRSLSKYGLGGQPWAGPSGQPEMGGAGMGYTGMGDAEMADHGMKTSELGGAGMLGSRMPGSGMLGTGMDGSKGGSPYGDARYDMGFGESQTPSYMGADPFMPTSSPHSPSFGPYGGFGSQTPGRGFGMGPETPGAYSYSYSSSGRGNKGHGKKSGRGRETKRPTSRSGRSGW